MNVHAVMILAATMGFAAQAHADPFCDALSKALTDAPAGFADLRAAQDSDDERFTVWQTNLALPGTSDCTVQKNKRDLADPTSVEDYLYSCSLAVTSGTTATDVHAKALATVRGCLPTAEVTGYAYNTGSGRTDYVLANQGIVIIQDGMADKGRVILEIQQVL